MVKNYIALEGFAGNDISVYKRQVIKMDEGKAAQLVADGKLAEYYNSCAIPRFDLSAMGAKVGDSVHVDTRSLYEALTSGIAKCTLDFVGMHFEWNVLAVKITDSSADEDVLFTGVFQLGGAPVLVSVDVSNGEEHNGGAIDIKMVSLAQAAG